MQSNLCFYTATFASETGPVENVFFFLRDPFCTSPTQILNSSRVFSDEKQTETDLYLRFVHILRPVYCKVGLPSVRTAMKG